MSQTPEHPSKATVEAIHIFIREHPLAVRILDKSLLRLEKVSNRYKVDIADLLKETYEVFSADWIQKDNTTFPNTEEKLDYCTKLIKSRYMFPSPPLVRMATIVYIFSSKAQPSIDGKSCDMDVDTFQSCVNEHLVQIEKENNKIISVQMVGQGDNLAVMVVAKFKQRERRPNKE